ncbi:hypothetical protein AB1Y20_016854 [Prymnesium parvum]|uniref:Uncharacterized protein n=1 Tax=Prymnesium parvum TaxID=97485 RepID=A0AB34IC46_PRYPA
MAPKAKGEKKANKGATDRAASPAPAVVTENAAPAGPAPSWKVHLARLAVPDGFDPGLLFSAAAEGRPCISLIEPLAILKESKDADIVAELKSLPAGEPPPAELIMKVLVNKFAEDKAAGIERKARPAEEGAEENIASQTPHEGEPADELIKDEPPPPDESADVYYLLKDFPRGPADGPAMSAAGFELDTLVTLKMDNKGLRLAAAAALEAAAAAAPAKGKGKAAEAAKVVDPAQAELSSTEEPIELPTDGLTEALVPVLGKVGAGFQETLAVALSMPAAEGWAKPAMIFSKLASVLYAVAQKKHMYNNFKLTLTVQDVPRVACPVDMTHYRRLLSTLPIHTVSVAYILHCMVEQVVLSTLTSDEQSMLASELSLQAIESMLCAAVEAEGKLPLTGPRSASESAAMSSQDALLVPFWDGITARELTPPPLGLPQPNKDELALQATTERNMHDALPVPAKHRRGMPAEASLTAEERGIERTELHHFSRFSSTQIDASMCLRGLARLINGADPHRGSRGHGWLLASRPWAEELSRTQLAQRMLELRATSRRSTRLHAYHARDDVLLYALHDSVPPEREGVDAWRCELFDLVSRKFGAWHAWLMRSGPDEDVPSAPLPPFGGVLYNLDERVTDLLLTTTSLYPCDHHILRFTMCGTYSMCTIEPRSGGYARMLRGIGMPPPPADFSVTFSDGGRAHLMMADDGEWSAWIGGVDGLQVALQCSGTVHMMQPHAEPSTDNTASDAATLILSGLVLSGAPSNEAEKLHLKAILLDVEPPEVTVLSPAVHMRSEVDTYNFDALKISLPLGSPRPPFLRFELWDKDPDVDPDASPIVAAESRLSNVASGGFDLVLSSPGREGADISLSGTFELERLEDVPKPEPTPAEVSRTILPTGVVIVHFEDGSKRVMHRNGNTADRKATGPHAGSWVTTNLRGLRMGTTSTGESFYVAPVAVASSTDPVSHNVVTTRADGTLVLSRADGSRLVQFSDGTAINSSPEAVKNAQRGSLSVRCDGYAPVDINLRLAEVTMFGLDGTDAKVRDASVSVHHRSGLQFTLSKEGKVHYFPAQLAWMAGRARDEATCVYKLDLVASTLETKDPQGSVFRVSFDQGHSVDLVLPDELSSAETPVAEDEDPDWSHPPKLFICRADGTGVELLRTADVAPFMQARDVDADQGICMHLREPVSGDTTAEVHTWVWRDWLQHTVTKLAADRDRSDAQLLLAYLPKVKYVPPTTTLLHFRRLLKREPLTAAQREYLEKELLEMEQYRVHEEKRAQELHIKDTRSEGEGESERDLQQELLQVWPLAPSAREGKPDS